MALNFNLMNTDLPGQIAGSFQQGYQGAQDRTNVLEQREQQKRTQLAQLIQNGAKSIAASPSAYKSIFARVKKIAGVPLDDDEKRYDEAFTTGGEEGVKKLAMADADFDMQTVLSLRDREAFEAYLKGKQPAAAPTAQATNALTAARVAPGALGSGTFDPMAPAGMAPTNALAPTAQTPVTQTLTNALAPAPVDQRTAIQNEIMQLSRFTDPRAAARVKALEKQLDAMQPMVVGGNIYRPDTDKFTLGPAAPGTPSTLARLMNEMNALPPGDPRRAIYQSQINKETTHARGATVYLPPQEKEEQKQRGKALVDEYTGISTAAKLAAKTIPSIESNLTVLDKGFKTGFGTETVAAGAKVLAALGVEGAEKLATNAQTFLANMNTAVLQRQLEQKGPQTESDAQRITATGAQFGNTPAANKFVLTVAKEQLKRDLEQRNFYDSWWKQNKTYDGAEDAWYSGEGGKSLFDRSALKQYATGENAPATQIPTTNASVAPTARPIPPAAVQMLLSGKGTDAQFDAQFGAGAAKRARGSK
jgi:hypothetical protein